jgi:hypothetical protein
MMLVIMLLMAVILLKSLIGWNLPTEVILSESTV